MDRKSVYYFVGIFIFFMSVCSVSAASTYVYSFNTSGNDAVYFAPDNVRSSGTLLQLVTDSVTSCRYSINSGLPYTALEKQFEFDSETLHKQYFTDLNDGVYTYYIKCRETNGHVSGELKFSFSVSIPISAKITLSKDPPLASGKYVITLKTSKPAVQPPSLSYSFDSVSYTPIPLSGSGSEWTGYLIIPATVGDASGSFRFFGKDFEGNTGDFISSGSIFMVDTSAPSPIISLQAIGYDGNILLKWYEDKPNKLFKIYRSVEPNSGYEDYYKNALSSSFSDTLVERGRTYYYRVSALDEAGNEGDLSPEVYATALFSNISVSSGTQGLSSELVSLVEGLLGELDRLDDQVTQTKSSFEEERESIQGIFKDLKLDRELTSALAELASLRKDVEGYKTQSSTRAEIERKVSSVRVRMAALKKKVPEQISISSEETTSPSISEESIRKAFLTLYPESAARGDERLIKKSLEALNLYGVSVKRYASVVSLTYLDGTKNDFLLVREEVSSTLPQDGNYSILEIVPPSVARSVNDIVIKNSDYNVLKEDTIISFEPTSETIVYTVPDSQDLTHAKELATIPFFSGTLPAQQEGITGYFSFVHFKEGTSFVGFLVGLVFVGLLGGYYFHLRKGRGTHTQVSSILSLIAEGRKALSSNNRSSAEQMYTTLAAQYATLPHEIQHKVYGTLEEFHHELIYHDLQEQLGILRNKRALMNEDELRNSVHLLMDLYRKLPERYQTLITRDYEDLFTLR